ncbi:MAG: GntR family transcriptional regulator [Lachnospiraceae bacterium]|nr:GntR family transcriptional regulator [Lachnospiraceae bacterium]
MVIILQDGSDVPVFKQIRNQIVVGISEGKLLPGEKLPTVRALAEEIGINSMTVNKAYQLLKQEGYIITDKRNGVRVREKFASIPELSPEAKEQLHQMVSEARIRGITRDEFVALVDEYYASSMPDGYLQGEYTPLLE